MAWSVIVPLFPSLSRRPTYVICVTRACTEFLFRVLICCPAVELRAFLVRLWVGGILCSAVGFIFPARACTRVLCFTLLIVELRE